MERLAGTEIKSLPPKSTWEVPQWMLARENPLAIVHYLELVAPDYSQDELSKLVGERIEALKTDASISSDGWRNVAVAQFRAIDLLYGKGNISGPEASNPLVDILTLITHPKYHGFGSDFKLAIEGKPYPQPIFARRIPGRKGEQRTFGDTPAGRKEFRTITSFGDYLETTLRGIFVIAEVSKNHPSILPTTLTEYEALISGDKGKIANTAIGLLEILDNARLIYDRRFYPLASQLRQIVFKDAGNYGELRSRYSYTILENRPFWHQGEVSVQRTAGKVKFRPSLVQAEGAENFRPFNLPRFDSWEFISRKREGLNEKVRAISAVNSIKSATPGFSAERAIAALKRDALAKAQAREEIRSLELSQLDSLKRTWRRFVEAELDDNPIIEKDEIAFVGGVLKDIFHFFSSDPKLSQKAKTNFWQNQDSPSQAEYTLKTEVLVKDSLFRWILAMRDPDVRLSFREAAVESPNSAKSIILLFRLLTYEAARVSFQSKEKDFIFDPNTFQQVSRDKAIGLLDAILRKIGNYVPDSNRLTQAVLPNHQKAIADLLAERNIKRIKATLAELRYRRIFGLKSPFLKSVRFADEDKEALKKGGKFAAKSFIGSLALLSLASGIAEGIKRLPYFATSGEGGETSPNISEGSFPKEIADRIPDAISSKELKEGLGYMLYGEIIHAPDGSNLSENGASVGFFPFGNVIKVNSEETTASLSHGFATEKILFPNFFNTENLDMVAVDYDSTDLVYRIYHPGDEVYPPIGWRVKRIYQSGGTKPYYGSLGDIKYEVAPGEIIVVADKIPLISLGNPTDSRVKERGSYLGVIYNLYSYIDPGLAAQVNESLAKDERLQNLHRNFILELMNTKDIYDDYPAQADIIREYALKYAEYTDANRYYALGFQIDKGLAQFINQEEGINSFTSLMSIANRKDDGYFCSVAAYAFRDFMRSGGIVSSVQGGINLKNRNGYLVGSLAHANNIIYLPTGQILEVDMTPQITEKTPQDDIDALGPKPLSDNNLKKLVAERRPATPRDPSESNADWDKAGEVAGSVFLWTMALSGAGLTGLAGFGTYHSLKNRAINKRIEASLRLRRELTGLEKDIVLATAGHLTVLAYDTGFPEKASALFSLIEAYDRQKHDAGVRWLEEEKSQILEETKADDAFKLLCQEAKVASIEGLAEIRRNLPTEVFEDIERANYGVASVETPYDFKVIFSLARVLNERSFLALALDVFNRLKVKVAGADDKAIAYKVEDILELLQEKYAVKSTPRAAKPLFNTIYDLLKEAGVTRTI